jgi:trimethylamine:corrinoid methyltransferase-like protein
LATIKALEQRSEYLDSEHTFRFFRDELRDSRLMSRERWAVWAEEGRKGVLERATDRVQALLRERPAEHLSGRQKDRLAGIEKRWLETLG